MFGILNINKPPGLTSRQVVNRVVPLVKPAKVGHAGTLDPMATGVLVVCVGQATKLISYVQQQKKTYVAEFRFGFRSNTDDTTGELTETVNPTSVTREELEAALSPFVGEIEQVPPQFSAVHVKGKRAYDLARQGQHADIKSKTVTVHSIEVLSFEWPACELDIVCGSGTYIRSIARDLGDALGCGAVMSALERTAIGPFHLENAAQLESLTSDQIKGLLHPALQAVAHLPRFTANAQECQRLRLGQRIEVNDPHPSGETVVVDEAGTFVALAEFDANRKLLAPRTVFRGS